MYGTVGCALSHTVPTRRRAPRLPIEVRREQALDAALRIICARGYGAASMEAIAREVGVAKTVIYEAFPRRAELLRALLEREERRILSALLTDAPGAPPGPPPALGSPPAPDAPATAGSPPAWPPAET